MTPQNLTKQKYHFIGIGGSGMAPLATIALQMKHQVSGSELNGNIITEGLINQGAQVFSFHHENHVPKDAIVVVSSAITPSNCELISAQKRNQKIIHRSQLLATLMEGHKNITVAGSHGKTTTTAMIGHLLHSVGLAPVVYCGGTHDNSWQEISPKKPDRLPYFVAEADESDGSFLRYQPFLNVLTDVGPDHIDYYGSLDHLLEAFQTYLLKTDPDGCNIVFWDNRWIHNIVNLSNPTRYITYGKRIGSIVRLLDCKFDRFDTHYHIIINRLRIKGQLSCLGEHNLFNLMATFAVALALDIDLHDCAQAMATFKGVKRRLEITLDRDGLKIFDDYAHNPDKIAASLTALRSAWPDQNLHVIFQPHRFSRLKSLYDQFTLAFKSADSVLVMPIYGSGETDQLGLNPNQLSMDISKGSKVYSEYVGSIDQLATRVKLLLSDNDIVISVGAGDIHLATKELIETL